MTFFPHVTSSTVYYICMQYICVYARHKYVLYANYKLQLSVQKHRRTALCISETHQKSLSESLAKLQSQCLSAR